MRDESAIERFAPLGAAVIFSFGLILGVCLGLGNPGNKHRLEAVNAAYYFRFEMPKFVSCDDDQATEGAWVYPCNLYYADRTERALCNKGGCSP